MFDRLALFAYRWLPPSVFVRLPWWFRRQAYAASAAAVAKAERMRRSERYEALGR